MKTRVLKSVLPIMAILLAVGLAFATQGTSINQEGFYYDPVSEQTIRVTVNCDSTTNDPCEIDGNLVYADEDFSDLLYKTAQ